jgi:hypothetical protein
MECRIKHNGMDLNELKLDIYTLNFYQYWITQRGWCQQRGSISSHCLENSLWTCRETDCVVCSSLTVTLCSECLCLCFIFRDMLRNYVHVAWSVAPISGAAPHQTASSSKRLRHHHTRYTRQRFVMFKATQKLVLGLSRPYCQTEWVLCCSTF